MSLGRFVAALASGSQELTVALAQLNFDVSLVKLEAPMEYQPLALALPPRCKRVAEEGDIHACARKLQALFSGLLTPCPNLHKAYGSRATEITKLSTIGINEPIVHGPFAEHVGVDGGSLWAAATSGLGAVAVHLLACMLARVFTSTEATSIWEEIVTIRKKEILATSESVGPDQMFAVLAAKSTLTREHLADWDASARAWLRAADEAMHLKHKQLFLIINNINVPVNFHGSTYTSVIQAWTRAMITIDKLIEGIPHSIVDGSVLLAISAWHIYPDMSVLGEKASFVKQQDPLVSAGGILTLGLEVARSRGKEMSIEGVYWSLPLAYYHYYGAPFTVEKTLNTDGSRLSLPQMLQVTIGAVVSGWSEPLFSAIEAATFLDTLWNYVSNPQAAQKRPKPSSRSWLGLLGQTAQSLLESKGIKGMNLVDWLIMGGDAAKHF